MPTIEIDTISDYKNPHQFEALFNNATIGIVLTNNKGEIINFNQFAEKQFGYVKNEVLGKSIEILIPAQFRHRHIQYRNAFYQHPQTRMMGAGRDLYAKRKDNTEFPVEVSLSYYSQNSEEIAIAFVVDITVRKKIEAALFQQNKQLEEKTTQIQQLNFELEKKVEDRTKMLKEALIELEKSKEELRVALEKEKELGELKSRFVSIASHEFRTPLTTILSSASLAKKHASLDNKEKHDKHLLKIQDAVKNLTLILEDFLSLGKLENGHISMHPEALQPKELIEELDNVVQEMNLIVKKGQHITLSNKVTHTISIDKNFLKNILLNLLSNAIKYSPENAEIIMKAETESNGINLLIADSGIGISEEDQKHLFERFFRAKNAGAVQGTGLGLHIVNRYVQLMNGKISINSKLNKGTTINVYLPCQ